MKKYVFQWPSRAVKMILNPLIRDRRNVRVGSKAEVQRGPRNVRCWGRSRRKQGDNRHWPSDVGYGFTGTLRPTYRIAKFDATAPLFFEPREDWEAGIGLQITKNDYSIHGYSPFLSYDFAYHDSNIELYQYTDHIFQVGLTKIY